MRYLILVLLLSGCAIMPGADYWPAEKHCQSQHSAFLEGNPIYFSCKDGSHWKRASHGEYDWLGTGNVPHKCGEIQWDKE